MYMLTRPRISPKNSVNSPIISSEDLSTLVVLKFAVQYNWGKSSIKLVHGEELLDITPTSTESRLELELVED